MKNKTFIKKYLPQLLIVTGIALFVAQTLHASEKQKTTAPKVQAGMPVFESNKAALTGLYKNPKRSDFASGGAIVKALPERLINTIEDQKVSSELKSLMKTYAALHYAQAYVDQNDTELVGKIGLYTTDAIACIYQVDQNRVGTQILSFVDHHVFKDVQIAEKVSSFNKKLIDSRRYSGKSEGCSGFLP